MQLIDLHCDTIYELKRRDDGSSLAKNSLSIDLDGMRRAGTILQIFACFIYRKEWKTWEDGYAEVFRLIDRMDREIEENKDEIRGQERSCRYLPVLFIGKNGKHGKTGMQKFSGLLTGWIGKSRKIKTRSGSCTMEVKLKRTENAERYQQWHPWKRAVFWMGSRNV